MQKKQQDWLSEQFKEMLGYIKEILQTGASLEYAVSEAKNSMQSAYGKTNLLVNELNLMIRQMQIGIPLEEAFSDFATRSANEDIRGFAEILVIARVSGGSIRSIIVYTESILREKQETMRQIHIVLHSKEYETKLLKGMPFGILIYFLLFSPEFLAPLYHSATGILIMSILLVIYLFLCYVTDKLSQISI